MSRQAAQLSFSASSIKLDTIILEISAWVIIFGVLWYGTMLSVVINHLFYKDTRL